MSKEERKKKHTDYMRQYYADRPEYQEATKARARAWEDTHKEQRRTNKNNWRRKNPEKNAAERRRWKSGAYQALIRTPRGRISRMVSDARKRARKAGIQFDEAIRAHLRASPPDHCLCCSLPLDYGLGEGHDKNRAPSIDRLDNSGGYTLGNVHIICLRCNLLKSNATVEELEMLVAYMRRQGHQ